MASASSRPAQDKTARVWNAANGKLFATLVGHTGLVWHAGFSPDGRRIVTVSWDNTVRVWNAANGQMLVKIDTGSVVPAEFSPDGQRIVNGQRG